MEESLLLLDTVAIKKYIFATRQLKEIRGASALLDECNRFRMEDRIKSITGADYRKIYANGGSALFVVPSAKVEAIRVEIENLYNSIGAEINIAHIPYSDADQSNFSRSLSALYYQAEEERYRTAYRVKPAHPLFHDCDSNKREYAFIKEKQEGGDYDLIAHSTKKKRDKNRGIKEELRQTGTTHKTLWGELNAILIAQNYPDINDLTFPDDFSQIADYCYNTQKYIAMIYADGNDMSRIIKALKTENELKNFSCAIDTALYKAVGAAVSRHLQLDAMKVLPFDILLIGGDDLIMVVPAQYALDICLTLVNEFALLTKDLSAGNRKPSLAVGLSFSKPHYPIYSLLNTTEHLLKSAKSARALRLRDNDNQTDSPMINYMLIQQSTFMDWDTFKRSNLLSVEEGKTYQRTCRPFTKDELMELMKISCELKAVAFPPGKLQLLQDAAFKSYYEAVFQTLFVLTHCSEKKGERKALEAVLNFPAKTENNSYQHEEGALFCFKEKDKHSVYKTAIIDLLEIYDFTVKPQGNRI